MINNSNVLLGLGLVFASAATIYVLFGPNLNQPNSFNNINKKRKKKEVQINALENTGRSNNCYVNAIVQALCSSDSFIDWLRQSLIQQELFSPSLINDQQSPAIQFIHYLFSIIFHNNSFYKSITSSSNQKNRTEFRVEQTLTFQLLKLLQEVNGKHNLGITLSSSKLLQILYNFNFESRNEQQDAHELFNFLTSSLENEILRTLSTTDSLNAIQTNCIQNGIHNEIQTDLQNDKDQISLNNEKIRIDGDLNSGFSEFKINEKIQVNEQKQLNKTKEERMFNISKELNNEYEAIKRSLNLKRNLPTKGLLAHQMNCLKCDHKFTIQFESFHCISLPLVTKRSNEPISLKDCLNAFVSNEILRDVVCENCQKLDEINSKQKNEEKDMNSSNQQLNSSKKKSTFIKRLTFAKLPQLLVIHFQRLICLSNGMPIKKEDRIKFPNILIMDEYELNAVQQKSNINLLKTLNLDMSNSMNNSNVLNNLNKPKNSNISTNQNDLNSCENSKLSNNQQLTNERQLLNGLMKESSMESNVVVSNENHLDHANLSNNNDISQIISSSIKHNTSPTSSVKSTLSDTKSNGTIEEYSTLSTPSKTLTNDLTIDSSENGTFVNNSQLDNISTSNKISNSSVESETKIETKATNGYSKNELSNKTPSNSIKSNSDLISSSSRKNVKYKYRLNACIVHFGSSFSGHYISHRRKSTMNDLTDLNNSHSGDWYFTSDNVIRNSSLEDALRSNAYMLFYERIK